MRLQAQTPDRDVLGVPRREKTPHSLSGLTRATLRYKVNGMDTNWAAANLQAIRTLMERSAIYRRALAPVMTFTGSVGVVAACVAALLGIVSVPAFATYWMCVSLVAIAGDFLLVRRQALKEGEPFWSPPTRRVTQALLPPLFVGCIAGLFFMLWLGYSRDTILLSMIWVLLYGCALHSAGFFMPRGIKLFAWAFLLGASGLLLVFSMLSNWPLPKYGNVFMGSFFGVAQLAYGIYLYFTEQRKNEA
jgi:hypothetical protein